MRLDQLRTQALRYLALGDFAKALRSYERIVEALPTDIDARMRVGDILAQCGPAASPLAKRVYAAVAFYDLQGGRPLHALVAIQALSDLGEDATELRLALAQLYGANSPRLGREGRGARLASPMPDTDVDPPDLSETVSLESVVTSAAEVAANTQALAGFPEQFPPLPLLSELSEAAFAPVLAAAVVRRLGHGTVVLRQGDPGDAFYFLAAGQVRVYFSDDKGQQELANLHEGAIFGEMALVSAQPRSASVEVVGAADLIEFGRDALRAAANELGVIATALQKFTRERLLKNLLLRSPLFQPFSEPQRLDLARRFTTHDVGDGEAALRDGDIAPGLFLVLQGQLEVVRGEEPFEQRIEQLGPGDCFGETSLLRNQGATATVRAMGPATVLLLASKYFFALVDAVPDLRTLFEEMSDAKLAASARVQAGDDDPLF